MELKFHFADTIDPVAVLALIFSIIGGAFALYNWWKSGPSLRFSASTNMIFIGPDFNADTLYVGFSLINNGDRPFTVKGIYAEVWPSWFHRFFGKLPVNLVINCASYAGVFNLPAKIDVGEEVQTFVIQTTALEKHLKSYARFGATHTYSRK